MRTGPAVVETAKRSVASLEEPLVERQVAAGQARPQTERENVLTFAGLKERPVDRVFSPQLGERVASQPRQFQRGIR